MLKALPVLVYLIAIGLASVGAAMVKLEYGLITAGVMLYLDLQRRG